MKMFSHIILTQDERITLNLKAELIYLKEFVLLVEYWDVILILYSIFLIKILNFM